MAGQSLEFTISASDQASKVVTTVQNKINNFGKDVGKSIAGVLGPMALVGFAVSKVTDYLAEMEKKAKEAFDFGAGLADSADKLGVTAEEFQKITQAAQATGLSVDNVTTAYKASAKFLADVKSGNAEAIETFKKLGFSVSDLEKTKPEDVLSKLSGVMSAATDPTQKMAIAMTVLGDSAKGLQATLAKGFDIAGAFEGADLISEEDAALLRQAKNAKLKLELEEKVAAARQAAREEFLKTPDGIAFAKSNTQTFAGGGTGGVGVSTNIPTQLIDAEIKRIAKKKKDDADQAERDKSNNADNVKAAKELVELDEKRKKAAEEKAAAEKAAGKEPSAVKAAKGAKVGTQSEGELGSIAIKSAPLMVSSLREIGGGMAGEKIASQIDLQTIQVDLTRSMLTELQTLNNKSRDTVDFTKLPLDGGMANFTKTLA